MIKDFLAGLNFYAEAIKFIREERLSRYFIYSGILGILVFGAMGILIAQTYDHVGNLILGWLPWDLDWVGNVSNWIAIIGSSVVFLMIFRYIMLVVSAPLMSRLSAEVESILYQDENHSIDSQSLLRELWRGFRIAMRNIWRELFWTILLGLMSLFPAFTLFTSPLLILMQSYFAGFGTLDYWAERHMSYGETTDYLPRQKGMLMGNGIIYVFLIAVPIIGVILIPTLSTVAGTLHACGKWEKA